MTLHRCWTSRSSSMLGTDITIMCTKLICKHEGEGFDLGNTSFLNIIYDGYMHVHLLSAYTVVTESHFGPETLNGSPFSGWGL